MANFNRKIQYESNKSAKVGDNCLCVQCGTEFIKKQWQQAFCCGKCKDNYWNRKGDRHSAGYYERYDAQHPERQRISTPRQRDAVRYCVKRLGVPFFDDIMNSRECSEFLDKFLDEAKLIGSGPTAEYPYGTRDWDEDITFVGED